MEPIPEAIVEKTWQEVAGFSPDEAKKEMMKIGNSQPELLAFVTESSKEMGQEVRELAIYMFLVVYRMFQGAHGKIKKISSEEIIECYEHSFPTKKGVTLLLPETLLIYYIRKSVLSYNQAPLKVQEMLRKIKVPSTQ